MPKLTISRTFLQQQLLLLRCSRVDEASKRHILWCGQAGGQAGKEPQGRAKDTTTERYHIVRQKEDQMQK